MKKKLPGGMRPDFLAVTLLTCPNCGQKVSLSQSMAIARLLQANTEAGWGPVSMDELRYALEHYTGKPWTEDEVRYGCSTLLQSRIASTTDGDHFFMTPWRMGNFAESTACRKCGSTMVKQEV